MNKLRQMFSSRSTFYKKEAEDDADFKIIVQGVTLHVHKFILAYNSPVFKKMFENNEKEISINNFTVIKIDEFLQFFYPELRATLNGT